MNTTDANGVALGQHDIVQITDQEHHWFPCLLVVDELKGWGVMAYTQIVTNDAEPNGQAYIRVKSEQIERVGCAVIV